MITISGVSLGQDDGLIGPCLGPYGTRRRFYADGVEVIVPDAVEEKLLRAHIDTGDSFVAAYQKRGLWNTIPPEGMWGCCYDVLRTKYLDPVSRTQQPTGWGYTCAGYFRCFEAYVESLRKHGEGKRGRVQIAPGLYAPSPTEAACIKSRFDRHNNIARAYSDCGASDIFPRFPGAAEGISRALLIPIGERKPLYEIIKTLYALRPSPHPPPPPANHHAPPDELDKKPNYWLYAGVIVGAVLIARR